MMFRKNSLAIAVMVAATTLSGCSSDDVAEILDLIPTEIELSATDVNENEAGAEIATISTDIDDLIDFNFTTDDENFVVDGTTLRLADGYALDYETEQSATFNITVSNGDDSFTQEVTIAVNDLLDTYSFMSKVGDVEASSVSYGGQAARHALIAELKYYISNDLQTDLDGQVLETKDEVIAKLNSFYDADENSWDNLAITFTDAKQTYFNELSSSYKSVKDKLAGNDASGQHKLWNGEMDDAGEYTGTNIAFAGWGVNGTITPTELVDLYFAELADIAIDNLGDKRYVPGAEEIVENEIPVYVTDNGTDLNQLIQKFLLMGVAYSQATDDYLDEAKGLAADNISGDKDGTKDYTSLEHQFDEGFGYFGAARDYLAFNDNELSAKVESEEDGRSDWNGVHDSNGDGEIDLLSEYNFGNSVNAAKRDRGTADNANPTDYTQDAMNAFLLGRQIINDNAGMALTDAQMTELLAYRDTAVTAWENSVAATVVHYINDLHADLDSVGTDSFDYETAAKHFSELKGFALGLQFNPYSPMTDEQFEEFHNLVQDAPVLDSVDVADYQADLLEARDILQTALSFDADNVSNW